MSAAVNPGATLASMRDIPRIEIERVEDFIPHVADRREPAIVTGIMRQWPAYGKWSPEWFKQTYPDSRFVASVNLPTKGVSYEHNWADHRRDIAMAEFIDSLSDFSKPAYVRRQLVQMFPGAESDVRFRELLGSAASATEMFLWIGTANTRTGLHFDLQDGMLAQFHGRKALWLVSPEDSRYCYPYSDSITKSQVTADAPDYARHPLFARATIWTGTLHPGEFVFFPRRWWHAITALDVSISSSFNWGPKVSWREVASAINAGGLSHWGRVSRDFVVHGLLARPYHTRMFDDPPFGRLLYDVAREGIERRLRMQ